MAGRLSLVEREVIERGLAAGVSQGALAVVLGRAPSTISREVRRGGGPRCSRRGVRLPGRPAVYRARRAQTRSTNRAKRPQAALLVGELAAVVSGYLEADWSPQQIAAMLPRLFPHDQAMRVSHETIYASLYLQSRGQLRRELAAHLRSGRTRRRAQGRTETRGRIPAMVNVSARPAEAADRAVPGHWEGDLIIGGHGLGAVMTLVERSSRFVILAPMPGRRDATTARDLLTTAIGTLPTQLRRSLTWDQGKELSQHAQFTLETNVPVFFCDPHSPWQRGTNENTNGLLRQYWPKGADLTHLTQDDCDQIAHRLNTRPRQTLNWQTPAQALDQGLLAGTG